MKSSAFQIILILGAVILGILLVPQILTSQTGGVSALIKFFGIGVGLICLIKPQIAPWVLTLLLFTEDYLKKIAVYYGITSNQVLYEVLGVSIGAFLAAAIGSVLTIAYSRRFPLLPVFLYMSGAMVCFTLAGILSGPQGTLSAGYTAASVGLPIIMASLVLLYFKERLDLFQGLLNFQFCLAVLWSVVAIKQITVGFSPMEWYYAGTGLSPVASVQMLGAEALGMSPRPFGLGSGAPHINGIACFSIYGVWMGFAGLQMGRSQRVSVLVRGLFLIGGMLIFAALFFGRLKTTSTLIPISVFLYFIFKHRWSTVTLYGFALGVLAWVIAKAEWLIQKLPEWNEPVNQLTGGRATILTLTGRLESLGELKNPNRYSFFGLERIPHQHDFISLILYHVGAVGLGILVVAGGSCLIFVHRVTWRLTQPYRSFYVLLLTMLIPYTLILALVGSGSFHVTPNNIRIWTITGGILLIATRIPEALLSNVKLSAERNVGADENLELKKVAQPQDRVGAPVL